MNQSKPEKVLLRLIRRTVIWTCDEVLDYIVIWDEERIIASTAKVRKDS